MPTQIQDELDSVYGDSAPSFTTVKFWAAEFKHGCKSLRDDERSGCPNNATTDENITTVHQMVLYDSRIKKKNPVSLRPCTSAVSMAKIHELHIELHDNLPYSPDLAPSDFFLFLHQKLSSKDR
ncbi:HTH_48 domain-containing protein [Trichonephila clavipes]|nr:HTH_48 domain-containing protein [Trichonephila clavipes]